ncbi:hypothetical protein [Candidatus Korobacter versatilis]|uniref:hypothetical protein n=1 Tax=Candidatus Korobacter versatilis TaxID=658062 RepID=UPI000674D6F0|nr:hypothetical protein [Candidatus Koribacter versatilis]
MTIALPFLMSFSGFGQDAPLISGGVGFLSTTAAGQTYYQPILAPVAVVPLGEHFLVEARADLRGFIAPENGNGPYQGQFFSTLEYAQIDYLVNKRLTITAGRFLTPFNTYNERLTAIWIRDLADSPLIYPIGTRTSGSSNGAMIRGAAANTDSWELNYTAYFSAACTVNNLQAGRAAGMRAGVFLPKQQLEVGGSYQRYLQDEHMNVGGAYVWWVPTDLPVQVRSEYAHSDQGHGYWIEGAFRFTRKNEITTITSRIQPMARVQQFFRGSAPGGLLPSQDTNEMDFGINAYLPQDIRLTTSYGRQFSSGADFNVWNVGVTYRFVLPLAGRHS